MRVIGLAASAAFPSRETLPSPTGAVEAPYNESPDLAPTGWDSGVKRHGGPTHRDDIARVDRIVNECTRLHRRDEQEILAPRLAGASCSARDARRSHSLRESGPRHHARSSQNWSRSAGSTSARARNASSQ
jgi:hypothetical protein